MTFHQELIFTTLGEDMRTRMKQAGVRNDKILTRMTVWKKDDNIKTDAKKIWPD
jgi:hypothetical protein